MRSSFQCARLPRGPTHGQQSVLSKAAAHAGEPLLDLSYGVERLLDGRAARGAVDQLVNRLKCCVMRAPGCSAAGRRRMSARSAAASPRSPPSRTATLLSGSGARNRLVLASTTLSNRFSGDVGLASSAIISASSLALRVGAAPSPPARRPMPGCSHPRTAASSRQRARGMSALEATPSPSTQLSPTKSFATSYLPVAATSSNTLRVYKPGNRDSTAVRRSCARTPSHHRTRSPCRDRSRARYRGDNPA